MRTPTTTVRTIDLDHDQLLILEDERGRMQVLHGAVWLTEPGRWADHRLATGAQWPLRGRGAVLTARGAVRLQIVAEAGRQGARWASAWRRIVRAAARQVTRLQLGPVGCPP